MPTRIVRTLGRDYEIAQVGEIEKVFCRELRLLEPGAELEAVRRQMEDEDRDKEAQANKSPERPTARAPKHRNKRRGQKRRHR